MRCHITLFRPYLTCENARPLTGTGRLPISTTASDQAPPVISPSRTSASVRAAVSPYFSTISS